MPSTSAMSCVVAPWKPRSANTRAAASMISAARRRGLARGRRGARTVSTVMLVSRRDHTLNGIWDAMTSLAGWTVVYLWSYRIRPAKLGGNQMTANGRPPFRADHIGSLLRPAALRRAFKQHAAREISEADYARVQDQCIRDVVRMQEEIGLKVVTDGEFRRAS